MTLSDYLRMPWTIVRSEYQDDGEYIALHVRELPGFVVAATTENELEQLFWPALSSFISSYLEDGESPPMPERMMRTPPQLELLEVPAQFKGEVFRSAQEGPRTRANVPSHRIPVLA
jgi:predicted RNase H-like HicB family nuclease